MDIQNQIQALQTQANQIRAKEFDSTIREIHEKMRAFGITIKDLQSFKIGGVSRSKLKAVQESQKKAAKPQKQNRKAVAIKYRGPNGETWTGRGLTPKWLAALVSQGLARESFTVNA
jgi:DNA-binding protein H-NS